MWLMANKTRLANRRGHLLTMITCNSNPNASVHAESRPGGGSV